MLPKISLVKRAVEHLYDGRMTVEEARKEKNAKNITALVWNAVVEDVPCRVSYKTIAPAGRSDTVDSTAQRSRSLPRLILTSSPAVVSLLRSAGARCVFPAQASLWSTNRIKRFR